MRMKKQPKPYKNQYLDLLAKLICVLLIYYFILSLSPESFVMNIVTTVLAPVIMAIFAFGIGRIDKSNADVELKVHRDIELILSENCPIWLIPNNQSAIKNMRFIEVLNIGETVISNISLIFGEAKNKNRDAFQIQYPIHKGEKLFVAIDNDIDISTVNVIHISYGFDEAVTFCGEMIEILKYQIFSERTQATKNVKVNTKYLTTCKRASLEQMIRSEQQENEASTLCETVQG